MLRLIGYLAIALLNQFGLLAHPGTEAPSPSCAEVVNVPNLAKHSRIMKQRDCILKENSEINRECKCYDVY